MNIFIVYLVVGKNLCLYVFVWNVVCVKKEGIINDKSIKKKI